MTLPCTRWVLTIAVCAAAVTAAAARPARPAARCASTTTDDCYSAALYPNQNVTQARCEAHGCCWAGSSCLYEARAAPAAQSCAAVSRASRVDCHPEPAASPDNCAARGCCWDLAAPGGALRGVPDCFYPHTDGYTGDAPFATPLGFNQTLTFTGAGVGSYFGGDAATLVLSVAYETQTRAHFSIADPADPGRWRIPDGLVVRAPPPATRAAATDYAVTVTTAPEPWGVLVTRTSSGQVLFDSRVAAAAGPAPQLNGLVWQPQYVEISSALPEDTAGQTHIFGLGEHSAPFQLPHNHSGPDAAGNLYSAWARDQPGIPAAQPGGGQNLYGDHPFYLVHDPATGEAFGVLMLNSNAKDVLLQPGAAVTWRLTGGVVDVYVFSGPSPAEVVAQYLELVGRPRMPPRWALGFHLCRWNYLSLNATETVWEAMQAARIPQDAQWNDIDYMGAFRDFTNDEVAYPTAAFQAFVARVQSPAVGQHYVQIVDPGISSTAAPGAYPPYDDGLAQGVFMRDAAGGVFRGHVWPGLVAFPDWSAANATAWWTACFARWRQTLPVDGAWIDMNELSNFCDGECSSEASTESLREEAARERIAAMQLRAAAFSSAERAGLFPSRDRAAFDAFVRDFLAKHQAAATAVPLPRVTHRTPAFATTAAADKPFDFRYPPYLPGRLGGATDLYAKTISADATHAMGAEYDAHSLFGFMEGAATAAAMEELRGERSLVISRSTFAGSGFHNGHWLGDNTASWADMYYALCGTLAMNLFGVPLVGADTGFGGDFSPPEMAVRWHQLGATVFGFFRNHNSAGKPDQAPSSYADPHRSAMRDAIALRYSLIPYWYSEFAHAHAVGATVTRPLFFEWPLEPALVAIDTQVMVGAALMASPVIEPGVTARDVYVPRGATLYDWLSGAPLPGAGAGGVTVSVPAPLDTVPLHVRGGFIVPSQAPAMTTVLQESLPLALTLALDPALRTARGHLWLDDGASLGTQERGAYFHADFAASYGPAAGALNSTIASAGFTPRALLGSMRILGVAAWPAGARATVNGALVAAAFNASTGVLTVQAGVRLDAPLQVVWG